MDIGFTVSRAGGRASCTLGDVVLLIDPSLPRGLHHLEVVGCPSTVDDFAGLPVVHVAGRVADVRAANGSAPSGVASAEKRLAVIGVDHVVVLADDVRATCAEIERVSGAPLKRVKESDRGIQGFHRLGSVILEVVERRLVDPGRKSSDATYWGFVVTVSNLDEMIAHLGPDVLGAAKPAVQPGRQIATVRRDAGLGMPVALMSPE